MTYSQEDQNRPIAGGYTRAELAAMSAEDMRAVMAGTKLKASAQAEQRLGEAIFGAGYVAPSPVPSSQDPYLVTAWGSNEEDYRTPSGQLCRLRKLVPEDLLELGILDEVSRLPGLVQAGPIRQGEGQPPTDPEKEMLDLLRDPDKARAMMGVIDKLVAYAVVKPNLKTVPPEGEERKPGQVYTDMVGFGDKVAIMEYVLSGVRKLDSFRAGS